jgi:hypothetical protein
LETWKIFIIYLEGTLYPGLSLLLEKRRDSLRPISLNAREIIPTYRYKISPTVKE